MVGQYLGQHTYQDVYVCNALLRPVTLRVAGRGSRVAGCRGSLVTGRRGSRVAGRGSLRVAGQKELVRPWAPCSNYPRTFTVSHVHILLAGSRSLRSKGGRAVCTSDSHRKTLTHVPHPGCHSFDNPPPADPAGWHVICQHKPTMSTTSTASTPPR